MEIKVDQQEKYTSIKLEGSLILGTRDALETVLGDLFRENKYNVVIDLSGLQHVTNDGWRVLVNAHQICGKNQGGKFGVIIGNNEGVSKSYEKKGFSDFFNQYDTIDAYVSREI